MNADSLVDVITTIWSTAATTALAQNVPANQTVISAFNGMNASMPYTAGFWGSDPLNVGALLAAANPPSAFNSNWVRDAYSRMYRAFYAYLEVMVNCSLVDTYMVQTLEEY